MCTVAWKDNRAHHIVPTPSFIVWPQSSMVQLPMGPKTFSLKSPTWSGAHPVSNMMDNGGGSFSRGKAVDVKLTTHLHLVLLRLRMNGPTPPLPPIYHDRHRDNFTYTKEGRVQYQVLNKITWMLSATLKRDRPWGRTGLDVWMKHRKQFKTAYKGSWRNLEPSLTQDKTPFKQPFQIPHPTKKKLSI